MADPVLLACHAGFLSIKNGGLLHQCKVHDKYTSNPWNRFLKSLAAHEMRFHCIMTTMVDDIEAHKWKEIDLD